MWVREKYKEKSCDNCKVSKQDFWTFRKLMHSSSHGIESTRSKWVGVDDPLAINGRGLTFCSTEF